MWNILIIIIILIMATIVPRRRLRMAYVEYALALLRVDDDIHSLVFFCKKTDVTALFRTARFFNILAEVRRVSSILDVLDRYLQNVVVFLDDVVFLHSHR